MLRVYVHDLSGATQLLDKVETGNIPILQMSKQRSKVIVIVWILVQQIFGSIPTVSGVYFPAPLMLSLAM